MGIVARTSNSSSGSMRACGGIAFLALLANAHAELPQQQCDEENEEQSLMQHRARMDGSAASSPLAVKSEVECWQSWKWREECCEVENDTNSSDPNAPPFKAICPSDYDADALCFMSNKTIDGVTTIQYGCMAQTNVPDVCGSATNTTSEVRFPFSENETLLLTCCRDNFCNAPAASLMQHSARMDGYATSSSVAVNSKVECRQNWNDRRSEGLIELFGPLVIGPPVMLSSGGNASTAWTCCGGDDCSAPDSSLMQSE